MDTKIIEFLEAVKERDKRREIRKGPSSPFSHIDYITYPLFDFVLTVTNREASCYLLLDDEDIEYLVKKYTAKVHDEFTKNVKEISNRYSQITK